MGTSRKALLFSEKNLNAMEFDNSGADSQVWKNSTLRTWMNGTADNTKFKHTDYFSMVEQGALSADTHITKDDQGNERPGLSNGGSAGDSMATDTFFALSYQDLINPLYGFSSTWNATDGNRVAYNTAYAISKNAYNNGGRGIWWSRSPFAFNPGWAWLVDDEGGLGYVDVILPGVAARPACFFNLESLIFKSASNDFDLSTSSAGGAGSILNPYVLVLPGEVPNGWTTNFISADKTPVSATVSGKTVTLEWSTAIAPAVKNWPAATDFVLSTGQSPIHVTSDLNSNKALQLTFAADVAPSGLKLSYNLNTDAIVFAKNGTQASVVNSFANLTVTQESPSTPNVIPTQARYDGSSPADLKELLGGAALTAAKAGKLSLTDSTPDGTRIPLGSGDYSIESRNLTIFISFLSKLGDGTHTLYFYNGDVQVGKVTLIVTNSNGGDTKDSGSSGCNAGFGSAGLLAMGIVLLGLNKAGAKKKK